MFSKTQTEKVAKDLGLAYRWSNPTSGFNYIIVKNKIAYSPFYIKYKYWKTEK